MQLLHSVFVIKLRNCFLILALQALLDSLDQVCKKVETPVEDHLFLSQLLQNKNLQSLITVSYIFAVSLY